MLLCMGGWQGAIAFESDVSGLVEVSCIACHDGDTDTALNFEELGFDLSDPASFAMWEKVYHRVSAGEMPPQTEDRPDAERLDAALQALNQGLRTASLERQKVVGRVPARRLTKGELAYTLQDLLSIGESPVSEVPDEVESGSFDTVGSHHRISAVHIESYLRTAEQALDRAIRLGPNPYRNFGEFADSNFAHLDMWHEKPLQQGGSITRRLKYGKGVALFADVDYLTQFTYRIPEPGLYRLTVRIGAIQTDSPLTAKLIVKDQTGGARLAKAVEVLAGEPQLVVVEEYLKPGDIPYLTFRVPGGGFNKGVFSVGGASNYRGPGLAILSQRIEGPMHDSWPPPSTRQLTAGLELTQDNRGQYRVVPPRDLSEWMSGMLRDFASRAFRRPVSDEEVGRFLALAQPAIDDGLGPVDALRIPLRSILSSPQFLMFSAEPGRLDDDALANRLSYFLWKSMPDKELFELASAGELNNPETLAAQVDRMLRDEKASRFVTDFVGQWLRVNKVNATTPDDGLYPEYDELLGNSIPQETERYFANLIDQNLTLNHVIDSEYTFLNRRLAEHYGIDGIEGQYFRRVELPPGSVRGGVLTHAAVLKTTANGTTTSPVTRGNFVLTNLLGTPPSPPPPSVGSIEPDTRGQTTIREILAAHREIESCNQCHRDIDPPGFALESFDPIGRYREFYRVSGGEQNFGGFTFPNPPKQGLPVDASGVTSEGEAFEGVREFKRALMRRNDQIARNFVAQLIVYATGAEIQFADRECVEQILDDVRDDEYPVRDVIHAVVQSELFRNL